MEYFFKIMTDKLLLNLLVAFMTFMWLSVRTAADCDSNNVCEATFVLDHTKWESVGVISNVTTYKMTVEGSKLMAVRGVATLQHHISDIIGTFMVSDLTTKWVDMLQSQVEYPTDDPLKVIMHQHYDFPWPVSDRDFALIREPSIDHEAKSFTLIVRSIKDDRIPEVAGVVRGVTEYASWTFLCKSKTDCSKTIVDVATFVDAKGTLPTFLINQMQKFWPSKTINSFEKIVATKSCPPFKDLIDW